MNPKYERMPMGEIYDRAVEGDPDAQRAWDDIGERSREWKAPGSRVKELPAAVFWPDDLGKPITPEDGQRYLAALPYAYRTPRRRAVLIRSA